MITKNKEVTGFVFKTDEAETYKQTERQSFTNEAVRMEQTKSLQMSQMEQTGSRQMSPMQQRIEEQFKKVGSSLVRDWDNLGEHHGAVNSIINGVMIRKPAKSAVKRFFTGADERSDMAWELSSSLQSLVANYSTKLNDPDSDYDMNSYTEDMFRLSMAADGYVDTHRGRRSTSEGRYIKENTKVIKGFIYNALKKIISEEDEKAIKDNSGVDATEADETAVYNVMSEFASQYKFFACELGKEGIVNTPRQRLQMKLSFFAKYERDIKLYRKIYYGREVFEPNYEIDRCIREYENCLRWKKILEAMPAEKEKDAELKSEVDTAIEGMVLKEDERQKKEKLDPEQVDKHLTKEQLEGIEKIDQWLVRNFNNGGAMGLLISSTKNPHFDFMNKIFTLSKRERLHMYYLVQTNKRKTPSLVDVGDSQIGSFIPDLELFKKRMVATRWKFWKRLGGEATYMHKLQEAFDITREYSSEIKSVSVLADPKYKNESEKGNGSIAYKKMESVSRLYKTLTEYRSILEEGAREKDEKKRRNLEPMARELATECESRMKELAEIDSQCEKRKTENKEADNLMDVKESVEKAGLFGSFAPLGPKVLMDSTEEFFNLGWGLDSAGFDRMHLWTGSISSSISVAGGAAAVIMGFMSLSKNADSMTKEELLSNITDLTKETAELVETGVQIGRDATSEVVKNVATGVSVVKAVCTGAKLCSEISGLVTRGKKEKKSYKLFTEKTLERIHSGGKLNEKESRLNRYEGSMMQLSTELKSRDKAACFFTGIEFIGDTVECFVPFVGKGISLVGFGLKKLFSGKKTTSIREHLFDSYYNTAQIRNNMMASLLKRYPGDQLKCNSLSMGITESLRKKIAVEAGFSDVDSACEHVARKYACYLRDKLFGDDPVTGDEKEQTIAFLKSLGIKYHEGKQKPDLDVLTQKLCAN